MFCHFHCKFQFLSLERLKRVGDDLDYSVNTKGTFVNIGVVLQRMVELIPTIVSDMKKIQGFC
jgi:hypothetical protein